VRALYFGTYERTYPRNAQVISCLRAAGVEVEERHAPVWEQEEHKWASGPAAALRLLGAEARLMRRPPGDFDVVIVGYPGHLDLPAAKRAARGRPVVFNPLVSLYDTLVEDRQRFGSRSIPARTLRWIDRRALRAADLVVADTQAHAGYLAGLARLPESRVEVCLVGAEDRLFRPPWSAGSSFLFVGKLIPLHGVDTILEAARLAPELDVEIVGSGQRDAVLRDRPPNVRWNAWQAYEELPAAYRRALGALGIFGTSAKAGRVIPNKVFQALACGAPVITADTPAARELLSNREDALLVPAGDPHSLAEAMRTVASDDALRTQIASAGRKTYEKHASERVLGARWRAILERLLR
jgi:glycosyltransferase involved in cell wall biosynthesis